MQAIYDDSIGDLSSYLCVDDPKIVEIQKEQNRRSPQSVIDLANKLRNDGLNQVPSTDESAPNMEHGVVKQGSIKFIYSDNEDLSRVRDHLNWSDNTKELNLTHNLIATKAGFGELMSIFDGDKILDYGRFWKPNPII